MDDKLFKKKKKGCGTGIFFQRRKIFQSNITKGKLE